MKSKLLISITVAASLVGSLVVAAPAKGNEDWQRIIDTPAPKGSEGVSVDEYGGFESLSSRQVVANAVSSGVFESWLCDRGNTRSGDCNLDDPRHNFGANAILPYCESTVQENCVESLALASQSGEFESARFVRHVNSQSQPAIPSQGLIAGGATSLFESSIIHKGGNGNYAATVVAQIEYDRAKRTFIARAINVGVYGYQDLRASSITARTFRDSVRPNGQKFAELSYPGSNSCAWSEDGGCGIVREFSDGTKVKLTIRVPDTITGWFRGRLKSPVVNVSRFSNKNTRIEVSAEPVTVSRFHAIASLNNTTSAEQKEIREHGGSANQFRGGGRVYPFSHWGSFYWIEMFRDLAQDTAVTTTSHWSFSTIENYSANPCLVSKSKLLGIVTTNATMYNGVVPAFRNGQLNYEVSGMHYLPDGSLSLGTYDLVMRSEVARCLYGFSKAPLNARVSVVNNNGERSTATTVVGEKNGWLRLAAYGFTFSKKTIKVKLNQKPRR
jgi:hypothetical protein